MRANAVRARIARLMLARGPGSDAAETSAGAIRVGDFVLRDDQSRALVRIRGSLTAFGGALIADRPGTGKTVLALAIAADIARAAAGAAANAVLVTAPAALRDQWVRAAARTQVPITFASLESLGRGRDATGHALVIVDEAHHARTPGTRRYAQLAAACADAHVLLLTATPVVNRRADRDALLALFLGARSARLTADEEARCIIRGDDGPPRPAVVRLGTIGAPPDLPGLAEAIAALPPALPLTDGSDARALVAMTLAMAWRSSLAALDVALRRRVQRGEALADILRAGGTPSRALLRHWVLQEEATQLAMPALFGVHAGDTATQRQAADAILTLERHLEAVQALRARIRPHRAEDAAVRAAAIAALADAHPDRRVVVFARHTETVRALHAALRHRPGTVAIIGGRAIAAAGRWSREEIVRLIGPDASPLRPDDPRAIRLILATDVLAEGIEMQGVGIVVHADLPWTPARLEQRVGRVTRVGSASREVLEVRLAAPRGARMLIRLGRRLARKRDARRRALAVAAAEARIDTHLRAWLSRAPHGPAATRTTTACTSAARDGFIAVVTDASGPRWLVGERRDGEWRVGATPRMVLRLLRAATGEEVLLDPARCHRVERLIRRALARDAGRALLARNGAHLAVRVRKRLSRVLALAPALARPALARTHAEWLRILEGPISVARERRLHALLRDEPDDARFARRLGALLSGRTAVERHEPHGGPVRLAALLVLSPADRVKAAPAPGPPSASPGTAAPR